MTVSTLIHRSAKVILYILLSLAVSRTLGSPETWMNHGLAQRIGHAVYGPGEIGADNFYDLYFWLSVITVFSITTLIYIFTLKIVKKITA